LICEVEDSETMKATLYGFPLSGFLGVSNEFEKDIPEFVKNSMGGAIYNHKLYPVFNFFKDIKIPVLKVFLIYEKFAIGVTRLITKMTVDELIKSDEGKLKGIFYFEGERVLVVDLGNLVKRSDVYKLSPLKLLHTQKRTPEKEQKTRDTYIILDNTNLAVKLEDVEDIIEVEKMCPINFEEYSGFVSSKDKGIINVKTLVENGKWILITKKGEAFRISNTIVVKGQGIKNSEDGFEYLSFEGKNYRVLR